MPKDRVVGEPQRNTLQSKHCTELSYRIRAATDVFDLKSFEDAIGEIGESMGWSAAGLEPKSKTTKYHAHVFWQPDDDDPTKTKLQVNYHAWRHKAEVAIDTKAPSAEEFFEWIGQFFKVPSVTTHLHGDFDFPVESWKARILPLPMKVPFNDGIEAEIEGVGIKLKSEPSGVQSGWLWQDVDTISVKLYADRRLVFKGFSPIDDAIALFEVAKRMVEEKLGR